MAHGAVVSRHERLVTNIIKEYSIPADLSWYLVDDLYILGNCEGDFHWVLTVIVLK